VLDIKRLKWFFSESGNLAKAVTRIEFHNIYNHPSSSCSFFRFENAVKSRRRWKKGAAMRENNTITAVFSILFALLSAACQDDNNGNIDNSPPTIIILSPTNGNYPPGTEIVCEAEASDPEDGDLDGSSIRWYLNDDDIDSGTQTIIAGLEVGTYIIKAVAEDSAGATSSDQVTISITENGAGLYIDSVSEHGDENGVIKGHISGVDTSKYVIYCDIEVEDVWWTKPSYASPATSIDPDGTWQVDITTGGKDRCATEVAVFLVPIDTDVDTCGPCYALPEIPEAVAMETVDRMPASRTVDFAGQVWEIKSSPICEIEPGPNLFSDSEEDIWIDDQGLHLTIKKKDNKWYATEAICQKSFGYGTYKFLINSRVDNLDPNEIAAVFLWDSAAPEISYREIDIVEFTKWGESENDTNAQFVVHPCSACPGCGNNCTRFKVEQTDEDRHLTLILTWQSGSADFCIYQGNYFSTNPPYSSIIHQWRKTDGIPEPGEENVRFNFWLYNGNAPMDGLDREFIIKDFSWEETTPVCGNGDTEFGEQCDDGNQQDGDGCSSACKLEQGIFINEYTQDGYVNGYVGGYDHTQYAIAVYIKVRGNWWTKPYWNNPVTKFNSDGSWQCDVVTGGVDSEATEVRAYLIPLSYSPPLMSGSQSLPQALEDNALDWAQLIR
jgi:cysteine-rich repeat protein